MSLRSRLARMPAVEPRIPFAAERARARTPAREEAPLPASGTRVIDELRRRMDVILARPARAAPPPVDVEDLPFAVEDTPDGPLHVRTLRLSGGHRVGHAPITAARRADSALLALLALDPTLAGTETTGALYLDTETTGLGPGAGTVAFLVGLAWFDDHAGLVVEQLLVRQLGEEAPMLARVAERIRAASMIVTFNGKSFDLPVLRTRFVMARMQFPPEPPHLDLLHVARRLHKARDVGAKLGVLEREVLGFVRENDVPSGEVSACYLHFLRSGDPRALIGVVEHNAWDVVSMAALVGVYAEPFAVSRLASVDFACMARTLKRAKALDLALGAAHEAAARGGDPEAYGPALRLELAKLYEHHAKDPVRALEMVRLGTKEDDGRRARRHARLERKMGKL